MTKAVNQLKTGRIYEENTILLDILYEFVLIFAIV